MNKKKEYLAALLKEGNESFTALELLVDDLHTARQKTLLALLSHRESDKLLWALLDLLKHENIRYAGNAAYVIGTIAEDESGSCRLTEILNSSKIQEYSIIERMNRLLTCSDEETVMNAAGTVGTICESQGGRDWILSQTNVELVENIVEHLSHKNIWIASNCALVLARFSIADTGCSLMLNHASSDQILSKLIACLGNDKAGRGMNAAFALGRLSDLEFGRQRIMNLPECDRMIGLLTSMLQNSDGGASKNACFAMSCVASGETGHYKIVNHAVVQSLLKSLCNLLEATDTETSWFAAMTLKTIASRPDGCLVLRKKACVENSLKTVLNRPALPSDLMEEITLVLEILQKLPNPYSPKISVTGPFSVEIRWEPTVHKSSFPISYEVFINETLYETSECELLVSDLKPYTCYKIKYRAKMEIEDGPFSDSVTVTTDEDIPTSPMNLRVIGLSPTQIRIVWEPPLFPNGLIKGYSIQIDGASYDFTLELSAIVAKLKPEKQYTLSVMAVNSVGRSSPTAIVATTLSHGETAPRNVVVNPTGRHEVLLSWDAPENLLGKLGRYDVLANGIVVYSGVSTTCSVKGLNEDTEYSFVVRAVTGAGRMDSKPVKAWTLKDEYNPSRKPLYSPPPVAMPSEKTVIFDDSLRRSSTSSNNSNTGALKEKKKTKTRKSSLRSRPSITSVIPKVTPPDTSPSWSNPADKPPVSPPRRSKTQLKLQLPPAQQPRFRYSMRRERTEVTLLEKTRMQKVHYHLPNCNIGAPDEREDFPDDDWHEFTRRYSSPTLDRPNSGISQAANLLASNTCTYSNNSTVSISAGQLLSRCTPVLNVGPAPEYLSLPSSSQSKRSFLDGRAPSGQSCLQSTFVERTATFVGSHRPSKKAGLLTIAAGGGTLVGSPISASRDDIGVNRSLFGGSMGRVQINNSSRKL